MSNGLATNAEQVTVIEHAAFAVSDPRGDIVPGTYHGLYVSDTRYLSCCILRLGGRRLQRLATAQRDHQGAAFYLTNAPIGHLAPHLVAITRTRTIDDGLAEQIRLTGYSAEPIRLRLTLEVAADFSDIFEVLGRAPMTRSVSSSVIDGGLRFAYARGAHLRTTTLSADRPFRWEHGRLGFDLTLGRRETWDLNLRIEAAARDTRRPQRGFRPRPRLPARRAIDPARVERWAERVPRLESEDPRIVATWRGAVRDMRALLLAEPGGSFIPAAGVPWFMAVFGRDASITALQTMIAGGDIAYGTLRELAAFQGRRQDPFRDEEPGRIPHEVRRGELAALDRVPHARYYGSVDATPLFVRLYADACRWSGWLQGGSAVSDQGPATAAGEMPDALRRLLPAAERALAWIDGRASGTDGLIWYRRSHRSGIRNQVWKDSGDSYRFADGRMAPTPIAAVEVQGYAVAAWRGMADVFEALGRTEDAARGRAAADRMVRRIGEAFWMPEAGTFAMGLDRYGRQIDAITSNPGHLLWSGAVMAERAAAVAERLTAPDMFTGYGVRTMSSEMAAFNPLSYHNGSVWPHDNSLIVAGLVRYRDGSRAWRIADGILDAAMQDRGARLPELFAGFDRANAADLVGYPMACSPQAWASGTVFHLVQSLLGLEPAGDLPRLSPVTSIPRIAISDLRVGEWRGDVESRSRGRRRPRAA